MISSTKLLSSYTLNGKYKDLLREVVEKVKFLMRDSLGCSLAGHKIEHMESVKSFMKELSGKEDATIVGDGNGVHCIHAFVNSYSANGLELDECTNNVHARTLDWRFTI